MLAVYAFVAGFFSKLLDSCRINSLYDGFIALIFSLLSLFSLYNVYSYVPEVYVAVLVALFLSLKFDTPVLFLIGIILAFVPLFYPPTSFDPFIFLFLFASSFLDELQSFFKTTRPFLPLFSLIIYFVYNNPIYAIAVFSFDVGYYLGMKIKNRFRANV